VNSGPIVELRLCDCCKKLSVGIAGTYGLFRGGSSVFDKFEISVFGTDVI